LKSGKLAIGVDVGGSSIKSAVVDLESGSLVSARASIATPAQASIETLLQALARILPNNAATAAIGIAFPSVIVDGRARTAANINKDWIGQPLARMGQERFGVPVVAINDADAAGMAEMHYGAGRGVNGTVLVLTLGTGIGSAIFVDGHLLPNTEFGHLVVDGKEAEHRASARVRVEHDLSWEQWTAQLNLVLKTLHSLIWPDLILLCGGITEEPERFIHALACGAPVRVGSLRADAGIVGAALATSLPQR
jgi:polyphosphate glucokinase